MVHAAAVALVVPVVADAPEDVPEDAVAVAVAIVTASVRAVVTALAQKDVVPIVPEDARGDVPMAALEDVATVPDAVDPAMLTVMDAAVIARLHAHQLVAADV
jgi:hypothetical protein